MPVSSSGTSARDSKGHPGRKYLRIIFHLKKFRAEPRIEPRTFWSSSTSLSPIQAAGLKYFKKQIYVFLQTHLSFFKEVFSNYPNQSPSDFMVSYITNSMAYGTRRFNAVFTKAPIIPILSRINPIPRIYTNLFKVHSNIVLTSTPLKVFFL